jgi:hypothetical protein
MKRISCLCRQAFRGKVPVIALLSMVLALCAGDAAAGQQKSLKDELAGAWTFISSTSQRDDGSATWGHNPKGLLIFTDNGRFSLRSYAAIVPDTITTHACEEA